MTRRGWKLAIYRLLSHSPLWGGGRACGWGATRTIGRGIRIGACPRWVKTSRPARDKKCPVMALTIRNRSYALAAELDNQQKVFKLLGLLGLPHRSRP